MRRLLSAILLLAIAALTALHAANIAALLGGSTPSAPAGPSYLIKQGFESTGYDNSETWTEAGTGTKDEDYTTTVFEGSQALRIAAAGQTPNVASPTFADTADAWLYFAVYFPSLPSTARRVIALRNGTTDLALVSINSTGTLNLNNGGGSVSTTNALSAGTWYHVWVHYIKDGDGGAASAFSSVAFSTDGVKPTSGNAYRERTTGTATADANAVIIGMTASGTVEFVIDKIRVSAAEIGDNPS